MPTPRNVLSRHAGANEYIDLTATNYYANIIKLKIFLEVLLFKQLCGSNGRHIRNYTDY